MKTDYLIVGSGLSAFYLRAASLLIAAKFWDAINFRDRYIVAVFRHRQEIIAIYGEHNTYHAGAYLGDGLHEGAITSAMRVAELISALSEVRDERLSTELSVL